MTIQAQPVSVPLSNRELVQHLTGMSPDTILRRHVDEGLPLRFVRAGQKRRPFLVVAEYQRWLSRQEER